MKASKPNKASKHGKALAALGASKGGLARKQALSAEERTAIAKKAAHDRWAKANGMPKETHTGVLKLGDGLPCSVLSNGLRVFSVNGLGRAFGSGGKGRVNVGDIAAPMPSFLSAANVRPFISSELMTRLGAPVTYQSMGGGRPAFGYEAEILSQICETLLDARAAGVLREHQQNTASAAELLMRGFARVGLIALIDEATGYQADRARDELQRILEAYISKELLPWTHKFPNEFFEQVYRLHGWEYKAGNAKRPQYVGKIINKYVYEQLPDGVLEELRRKNPPVNGRRKHKHFQFLTEDTGNPHLDRQIIAVTTIMKLSTEKHDFVAKFKKLYPRSGDQVDMELDPVSQPGVASSSDGIEVGDVVAGPRESVLRILKTGNATATKDLAAAAYGDDKASTLNKMRRLLGTMKAEGLIDTPSPGIWRSSGRSPA